MTAKKKVDDMSHVQDDIEAMRAQMHDMETLFKRRFDEISMEINATSQLVGMAEDGVKERFGEIVQLLSAISRHGDGNSRVNAGVELDAVVKITEDSANKILDAADNIAGYFDNESDWNDGNKRKEMIGKIKDDIQEILIACSFQDITGQRINKALENLRIIEDRLGLTLAKFGIDTASYEDGIQEKLSSGVDQDEIDALFAVKKA